MPHALVYGRTPKGTLETRNRASALPRDLAPVLKAIDGRTRTDELALRLAREPAALAAALEALQRGGYIEPAAHPASTDDELDFTAPDALARLEALAQSRAREEQAALARAAQARRDAAAASAPAEAQAHVRAESEAQARAHAEAHARAMVEAQLKATGVALARAQALARDEAQARARVTADLQVREAAEARARADAASRARAESEREMRAELARLREEAQHAIAAADARAAAEQEAREAAEARIASELDAQRRAHAAARVATQVRMNEERVAMQARVEEERAANEARIAQERAARVAAEARVQAELEARRAHEAAVASNAEAAVRMRVAEELRAREEAERAADALQRAEAAQRARLAAAAAPAASPHAVLPKRSADKTLAVKIAAAGIGVTALAAALALPRVPLDAYVPGMEKALSEVLRQPVRVARMQYRVFPAPELVLDGLTVGATYGSRVERVLVGAWPWDLLAAQPHADSALVSGMTLDRDGVAALAALLDERGVARAPRVQLIRFESARLPLQDLQIAVSNAVLHYERDGSVRSIEIASGGAHLRAAPVSGAAWRIVLDARNWQPPLGPALRFDALTMKGVIADRRLRSASIEAQLAGGAVTGSIAADWRNGVRAEGRFQLANAQLGPLMAASTSHFTALGTVSADAQYVLQGATLARLLDAPRATARFSVDAGELGNVDLLRALQQVSSRGIQGGRTRFDRMEGELELSGERYRYRQLKLASGPMTAAGDIEVGPRHRLGGTVTAGVHTATRTAIHGVLAVSGTLVNPVLRP